jgi:hypothetical protein
MVSLIKDGGVAVRMPDQARPMMDSGDRRKVFAGL